MNKLKSILFALLLMPLSSAMADVSCPSGYTTVSESDVYVSLTGSCPSGHTQVGGEYGGDNVQNCIDSLANGASVCTFYETSCQSGKYFDGTSHQICQAGAYCDGSGTATPGVSSCSSSCPANSNSSAGATSCTCNTGYNYNGGTTTTTGACTANTYTVAYDCNGGTGSTTATATYMDVFTPNTNVCARTGYEFVEWTMDGSAVGDSFTYNYTSDKTLVAVWKQSSVTCEAGEYLPANSTSCSSCLSGSYCPGGTYVMSDTDIGLNPCPANSNSSAGATSCTCNDTYTVTGLLGGNIQTTTADCKKISCGAGNILINGSCAKAEFTITTTDMDAGTDFSFEISASGTYYIDWGDGSDVQKIEKTDLASRTYHHTYTSSGVRTIGMYGDATGYTSTLYVGAISFRGNNYIDKVGGSLGAIFSGSAHSMFYYTFYECRSLTEIPSTLFDGVTGNNPWMFGYTFRNCTSLKAIPENLFSGISGSNEGMFYETFASCTKVKELPKTLFSGVTGRAVWLFKGAFSYCYALETIPETLFSGISGGAQEMFEMTFANCTSLKEIPGGLFDGVTSGGLEMFYATFYGCTALESLPSGLFKNVSGKIYTDMFKLTFSDCTALSGYVPANTFAKLSNANFNSATMANIFRGTALETQCPVGMYQYKTGFESAWDSKVACDSCPEGYTSDVGATEISQCKKECSKECNIYPDCPNNSECNYITNVVTDVQYYGSECQIQDFACGMEMQCKEGYVEVDGQCKTPTENPAFVIKTTPISAGDEFWLYISAVGTYYIDWGDGSVQTIVKTDAVNTRYGHIYKNATDEYVIKMAGLAERYNSDTYNNIAAIRFSYDSGNDVIGNIYIKEISGSLGEMFPTFSSGTKKQPSFRRLFTGCTNLTGALPDTLFDGVYSDDSTPAAGRMFMGAFQNTAISEQLPSGLFKGMSGQISENMFREAFRGCSSLTGTIPSDLFAGLRGELQTRTFYATFQDCTSLEGYIPRELFVNFLNSSESNYMLDVFKGSSIATSCEPYGMSKYDTGFNTYFGDHVSCVEFEPKFDFTVDAPAGNVSFAIGAAGKYAIDWGDGTGVQEFYKADTTLQTIYHTYAEAGEYNVRLSGKAEAYHTSESGKHAAISFSSEGGSTVNAYKYLTDINGSLGAIFSTLEDGSQPRFHYTFYNCTKLVGDIPEDLFAGVQGQVISFMFDGTFKGAISLEGPIPEKLFGGLTGTANNLFSDTFSRIIPGSGGLPMNLSGSIPAGLFAGIKGEVKPYMFYNTFYGCPSLTGSIPASLFSGLKGNISTGSVGTNAFRYTFEQCSGLTGYIPPELFDGLSYSGTYPTDGTGPMRDIFNGADGLATSCPSGTYEYHPIFEPDWDGHVSCYSPSFEITTTELSAGTEIKFSIAAAGRFTIYWGDGKISVINKSSVDYESYSHKYENPGVYYIGLSGYASAYPSPNVGPQLTAISFSPAAVQSNNACTYVAGIRGSLGAVFGTLADGSQPSFRQTFDGCSNMGGTIPTEIFEGIHGQPVKYMFEQTFKDCTGLEGTIPNNLFGNLDGSATEYLFYGTFLNCSGLKGPIPADLFSGITVVGSAAKAVFSNTFNGCTGLDGSIPADLFKTKETSILANRMFADTFKDCISLTGPIPADLFSSIQSQGEVDGVSGGATGEEPGAYGFYQTFAGCTKLDGEIPENLFSGISGKIAYGMFVGTFKDAFTESGVSSTVPKDLFDGITYEGDYMQDNTGPMRNVFAGSNIAEECPTGTTQYFTGYEPDWTNKVACAPCPNGECSMLKACDITNAVGETTCQFDANANDYTKCAECVLVSCNPGYKLYEGACIQEAEFTITTTDMPADTLFEFMISAAGDYTIDWGDGNIEFISIPTPAVTMISHTYTESGVRTIGIAGDATSYNTDEDFKYAVISFTDEYYVSKMVGTAFNYIAKIEGSLGDIFSGSAQNMFANTFGKCENLTEIPGDLFKGVSGAANDMFRGTFAGCTSLETIPMGLFSGATGAADSMFENVFSGCTGLQSLPEDLFASVVYEDASKDVTRLFTAAFIGCTGLTELPANLFSGIKVAGPQMFNATFANSSSLKTIYSGLFGNIAGSANSQYMLTFANCSSLSEIPEGLFASFSDDGENDNSAGVFYGTFGMCASLNKIPENLFENVTRATQNMFLSTFAGCEKLSNIPEKLFANIEGKPAEHSFANTFAGCTGLTGYVPATLFEKMDSTDYEAGPMTGIFEGTNYDTQCPVNNYQYKTGFEADWSGKVACTMCPDGYLSDAGSTAETQCYIPCEKQCKPQTCPENASCVQGEITTTSGKQFYGSVCDVEDKWCDITINCNNGYHQENGGISILEKTPLIPVEYHVAGEGFAVVDGIGNATNKNLPDAGLTENNTWAMRFDYGTVYGRASCQPSIDAEYEYVMYNVENVLEGEMSVEEFETGLVAISDASKAKYTTDILREVLAGTKDIVALYEPLFVIYGVNENANYKTTDTGAYCNCQMTDFAPTGGTKQSVAGTNWVSLMFFENAEGCSESCSSVCAAFMIDSEFASLRAAIYDALYVDYSKNMCVANIIDVPAGYYLPANTIEPVLCPTNSYCPGMTGITIHELQDQGLFPCPDSTSSVAGSSMLAQCVGQRTLHIGDDITMNLTTVRPTTERVMVFDVLGELYYGSLSDTEKTVTSETDKQFRIFDGAKDYWLHDYTVQ